MSIHTQLAVAGYGVTVTIDEASQTVMPDGSTTYTVRIKNTGDFDTTYDVVLDGTAVTESSISVTPVVVWTTGILAPEAEEMQTVTVTTASTLEATYNLAATATCNEDTSVTGSATSELVVSSASNEMHIDGIEMSTIKVAPNIKAMAKVTIVDEDNAIVEGAVVYGQWSGLTSDYDFGTTDANGQVSLDSDGVKKPIGTYTFTVTNVTKDGWTYDLSANTETHDSIIV